MGFVSFLFFLSFFAGWMSGPGRRGGDRRRAQRREKHRVDQAGGEVRGKRGVDRQGPGEDCRAGYFGWHPVIGAMLGLVARTRAEGR
jgi:hypothetical protein